MNFPRTVLGIWERFLSQQNQLLGLAKKNFLKHKKVFLHLHKIAQIQKDAGEALRQAGIQDSLVIENNYSSSSSSDLDRFYVLAANQGVDAVIADNDTFQMLAGQGYFTSLDSLDSSSLIYAAGYKDSDQITFEDNETGKGETQPYGIRFGSSVLSFVASSPNETAFQIFNQTLTENDKYAE